MPHGGQIRVSWGQVLPILSHLNGYRGQIRETLQHHGQIRGQNVFLTWTNQGGQPTKPSLWRLELPILSMITSSITPILSMIDVRPIAEPYSVHDKRPYRPHLSCRPPNQSSLEPNLS